MLRWACLQGRLDGVLSKYLRYVHSIAETSLAEKLDVQRLSSQLGLGGHTPEPCMTEQSEDTYLPGKSPDMQHPASPATTLWRAAATQWQQACSQWHETARCSPKSLKSSPLAGRMACAKVFSSPVYRTPPKPSYPSFACAKHSCVSSDLSHQLRQRFLSNTALCSSQSAEHVPHEQYTACDQQHPDTCTAAESINPASASRSLQTHSSINHDHWKQHVTRIPPTSDIKDQHDMFGYIAEDKFESPQAVQVSRYMDSICLYTRNAQQGSLIMYE